MVAGSPVTSKDVSLSVSNAARIIAPPPAITTKSASTCGKYCSIAASGGVIETGAVNANGVSSYSPGFT